MVSELHDSPGHKVMKSLSCEEAYERMDSGLCLFCDELDTPSHHQLKHKGIQIFMTECDDDQVSEDKEDAHQEIVKNPDQSEKTVTNLEPFMEAAKKFVLQVKEVKVSPQRSIYVNGKNIEHQVFDQTPLRITSMEKYQEDSARLMKSSSDVKPLFSEMTAYIRWEDTKGKRSTCLSCADRVWEPGGVPAKLDRLDWPEKYHDHENTSELTPKLHGTCLQRNINEGMMNVSPNDRWETCYKAGIDTWLIIGSCEYKIHMWLLGYHGMGIIDLERRHKREIMKLQWRLSFDGDWEEPGGITEMSRKLLVCLHTTDRRLEAIEADSENKIHESFKYNKHTSLTSFSKGIGIIAYGIISKNAVTLCVDYRAMNNQMFKELTISTKKFHEVSLFMSLQQNLEMVISLEREIQDWIVNALSKIQMSSDFDLKACIGVETYGCEYKEHMKVLIHHGIELLMLFCLQELGVGLKLELYWWFVYGEVVDEMNTKQDVCERIEDKHLPKYSLENSGSKGFIYDACVLLELILAEFVGCKTHGKKLLVLGFNHLTFVAMKLYLKHKWRSRLLQSFSRLKVDMDNVVLSSSLVKTTYSMKRCCDCCWNFFVSEFYLCICGAVIKLEMERLPLTYNTDNARCLMSCAKYEEFWFHYVDFVKSNDRRELIRFLMIHGGILQVGMLNSFIDKESVVLIFYPCENFINQSYTTFGYMKMQMVVAHVWHRWKIKAEIVQAVLESLFLTTIVVPSFAFHILITTTQFGVVINKMEQGRELREYMGFTQLAVHQGNSSFQAMIFPKFHHQLSSFSSLRTRMFSRMEYCDRKSQSLIIRFILLLLVYFIYLGLAIWFINRFSYLSFSDYM